MFYMNKFLNAGRFRKTLPCLLMTAGLLWFEASGIAGEPKSAPEIAKSALSAFVSIGTFDSIKNPLAIGSGFFIAKKYVVTNYHVIQGSTYAVARLGEKGLTFTISKIVVADKLRDLAILEVDRPNENYLMLGDSGKVSVGEKVYALGSPEGLARISHQV